MVTCTYLPPPTKSIVKIILEIENLKFKICLYTPAPKGLKGEPIELRLERISSNLSIAIFTLSFGS